MATVLSCENLPTLPAVGVQLLSLTRDPGVSLDAIAEVIETDPALSVKVLKTVNSSMFGLKTPCTTIRRALGFLGLSAVKSIVLGFSLMESTCTTKDGQGYDLTSHWKRSIFAATAARILARHLNKCDPEEAFAAALFQDLGAMAMHAALGQTYVDAVGAEPDHSKHLALEQAALGFTHAEVGAALAHKWRLPNRYQQTIQHHHSADRAAEDCRELVRLVSLGSSIADTMTSTNASAQLPNLLGLADAWFELSAENMAPLLTQIGEDSTELGWVLGKPVGVLPDAAELLRQANEELVTQQLAAVREAERLRQANQDLEKAAMTDGLTGLGNRKKFDAECARLFVESSLFRRSVALLMLDGDKFKSVNDTHGHPVGDAVLKELSKRIAECVGARGIACRYGGEEFGVLLAGVSLPQAVAIAEEVRNVVCATAFDVSAAAGKPLQLPITVSVGVGLADPAANRSLERAGQLIEIADRQLYSAKHTGRNRVCAEAAPDVTQPASAPSNTTPDPAHAPAPAPAPSSAQEARPSAARRSDGIVHVLLLEDDPLAAKIVAALIQRTPNTRIEWVKTAAKGTARLVDASTNPNSPVDVVVCDLGLGRGSGLAVLETVRKHLKMRALPFLIISASEDPKDRENCIAAGANAFINKENVVHDLPAWLTKAIALVTGTNSKVGLTPPAHASAPAPAAPPIPTHAAAGMLW